MLRRMGPYLVQVILLLLFVGCTRIPEAPPAGPQFELAREALPGPDIPVEWGKLVSVSLVTPSEHLWFQNDSGEIRRVSLDLRTNSLRSQALVIRRK